MQQILTQLEDAGLTTTEAAKSIQTTIATTPLLTGSGVDSAVITAIFALQQLHLVFKQEIQANQTKVENVTTTINTSLTTAGSSYRTILSRQSYDCE